MSKLKKILHIDDDDIMRMMFRKSMERTHPDIEVVSCVTMLEFIDHLSSFKPDLLIIDVVMPIVNGPTLLKKIRALSYTMPAIFMTGHETVELEDQASLEPILDIIHKPFVPAQVGHNILRMWENLDR